MGETLYTEQSIARFYSKYRAECFSLYLMEALEDPKYIRGIIPDNVTIHEANCWHALYMSQQDDFDESAVIAKRCFNEGISFNSRREHLLLDEYAKNRAPRCGGNFDPINWVVIPRSYATLKKYLAADPHNKAANHTKKWDQDNPTGTKRPALYKSCRRPILMVAHCVIRLQLILRNIMHIASSRQNLHI